MQHNAVFHQGLHCLLRLKQSLGTEIHNLENSTCDHLKYPMGSPEIFLQFWEGALGSFRLGKVAW